MWQYCPIEFSPTTKALIQGQVISMLIAGTGIFATLLSSATPNTNFPLFMNLFNYLLLSTFLWRKQCSEVCSVMDIEQNHKTDASSPKVAISKSIYIFAAILDVEANFLVLLAYNYTSITSVMMLDCFTIPCAMLLSYFFLGCRYKWKHGIGTMICLLGLICIVVNDAWSGSGSGSQGSNPLLGDILCLCSAVLYASSNVLQESLVKFYDRNEYLGYLGSFGSVLAFVQFMIIDFHRMQHTYIALESILAMIGFVLCLFFMYINTTSYLKESDATLFNLSLLTSDVYAVIFSYFFYQSLVSWMYFLAFGLVILGLSIYHAEKPPMQIGQEEGDLPKRPKLLQYFTTNIPNTASSSSSQVSSSSSTGNSRSFEYNPILDDSVDRTRDIRHSTE